MLAKSQDAVEACAPDAQVLNAGRKLATPRPWSEAGCTDTMVWGLCQGSGKTPYQVSVDLSGPRYKCSCPSRKFPCKHAVALLILWAQGHVSTAGMADFAAEWAQKSQPQSRPAAKTRTPEEEAAAAERAAQRLAQREQRIDEGFADLERWLGDQITQGLAHGADARPEALQDMAARMVDSQAPGMANRLLRAAAIGQNGADWPARTLHEFGLIQLLSRAWAHREALDEPTQATVRQHVGFTVPTETVLTSAPVTDTWTVLGMRDAEEERVSSRRVWLWGQQSGRFGLAMFFAAGRAALDSHLYPGTQLRADAHFYPGRVPLRVAMGESAAPATPATGVRVNPTDLDGAGRAWVQALAQDPWLEQIPLFLRGRFGVTGGKWAFLTDTGAVRMLGHRHDWRSLLLQVGDAEVDAFGEISEDGFLPLSLVLEGEVRLP